MQFDAEFSTILDVRQNQDDLILRLDISDWFSAETYKNVVLELKLIKCQSPQKSFEEVKQYIGELVWHYEFLADKKVFDVLLDDGSQIEIACEEISETKSDLTINELFMKFQFLAENYQRESESSLKGWGKYQQLNNLLKTEVERELQNWGKRKIFFEQNESKSADKAETVMKLCEKILNYIQQVEKENNA